MQGDVFDHIPGQLVAPKLREVAAVDVVVVIVGGGGVEGVTVMVVVDVVDAVVSAALDDGGSGDALE